MFALGDNEPFEKLWAGERSERPVGLFGFPDICLFVFFSLVTSNGDFLLGRFISLPIVK